MPAKVPFRVIHVSGQDEVCKALELNTHSPTTKGWQSSRFCLYPQDIVLQLDFRARLRKIQILSHQYLIATKIEFYVGDVSAGTPVSLQNARYTRLGYVALSSNEKTGFKARELKSVHVDAVGHFVKFVIHKNHVNKHNLYNQVGLIALNVIGDEVDPNSPYQPEISDGRSSVDQGLAGVLNRPDYISPLDDLAFDMYQDPEVAQIIRKLENKKQDSVLQEKYDYAKKLKSVIQDLQKVGEKLGKFEVEKRQAVENEDYDKAKLKKVQMDEYRLQVYKQLEIHDLLGMTGSRQPQKFEYESTRQLTPPRLAELPPMSNTPLPGMESSRTPYDERPLPAIKNKDTPRDVTPLPNNDDRPLPVHKPEEDEDLPPPTVEEPSSSGNVTGEPELLSDQDQREAAHVIDEFGLALVAKAYSKTWSYREDALLEVYRLLSELDPNTDKEDAKSKIRAAIFLINRGVKDKVLAVFTASLNLLKMILTEYVPKHKIPKSDIVYVIDKTMPNLIQKTGDTAVRQRDAAKAFIIEESKFPEVKPLMTVPLKCVEPFKLSVAPRLGLSRTEMVDILYKEHGLENNGLSLENMMKFCTVALQHTAGEIREKAERIIVALYKDKGAPVKDFLPPDDDKTRKNVLYKQLFEAFDRIDGKPSKEEIKKEQQAAEKNKQKEIDALQQQLAQLKDMAAGKAPVDEQAIKEEPPKKEKKESKAKAGGQKPVTKKPADEKQEKDDESLFQIDKTCIFCAEKNDQFTEEGLDLHYWKSCPMLKRCSYCKQVVEIAGLTDHLLTECESKEDFAKCPRCSEAIPKSEFDQHVADKACNPSEPNKSHCPLCHQNHSNGEEGWKVHLMGKDGCKQNPRRLQALNKQGKGQGKGGKSQPSKTGTKTGAKATPRK